MASQLITNWREKLAAEVLNRAFDATKFKPGDYRLADHPLFDVEQIEADRDAVSYTYHTADAAPIECPMPSKEDEQLQAIRRRQWDCGQRGNHKDAKCMVRGANPHHAQVCVFCGITEADWEVMQSQAAAYALWGRAFP